jgi:thioesterase domain-containing protein
LSASEDRARRLEEKYRSCKMHLNSAIQEQQDLYTRSKKQWEETLEKVRTMEKSQRAGAEMAVRKAEVLREQMMEKVRQTVAQNKSEALECRCRRPRRTHVRADPLPSVRKDRCPDATGSGEGDRAQS